MVSGTDITSKRECRFQKDPQHLSQGSELFADRQSNSLLLIVQKNLIKLNDSNNCSDLLFIINSLMHRLITFLNRRNH
jgi:hypothetical protein